MTRHRAAVALLDDLLARGHMPVLDLEDSVQCVFDSGRCDALKEQARQGLRRIAPEMRARGVPPGRILVRINDAGTRYHAADMVAVMDCFAEGFFPEIMLPKVNGPEDVLRCLERVHAVAGNHACVTPVIETVSGVERMEEILNTAVRSAAFGYFDYALDAGHWPLYSQSGRDFWDLAGRVRGVMERHGVCYIHPPSAHLDDDEGLLRIKAMLQAAGGADFGMCSLGGAQSAVLERSVAAAVMNFDAVPDGCGETDPCRRAEWVVRCFEEGRSNKRSFAVEDGYFISPHEYQLAKRFMEVLGA